MARYFRPLVLTAGRNKSAYFSRRDDSKLTSNRTLSQLYVDREAAEHAIERYRKRYPMDEIVYSEIEEVDGSRESNPIRRAQNPSGIEVERFERIAKKVGYPKAIERARAYLASQVLGRPFRQTAEEYERTMRPELRELREWVRMQARESNPIRRAHSRDWATCKECERRKRESNPAPSQQGAHVVDNKAERGDLMVYEVTHSMTFLRGGTETRREYELAIVTSARRDGIVGKYRRPQDNFEYKNPPAKLWLIHHKKFDVMSALAAYEARPWDERAFKSLEEAKEFLGRFRK